MIAAVIIKKDDEILLIKNGEQWQLPQIEVTETADINDDLEGLCKDYNVTVELMKIHTEYKYENQKYLIFDSILIAHSWENKGSKWVNVRLLNEIDISKEYKQLIFKLGADYEEEYKVSDQIKDVIIKICNDSGAQHEIRQSNDWIKVFIYSDFGYCPFVFSIDFVLKSDTTVNLFMSWGVPRINASGDKTDMYILFANMTAIILKSSFNQSVYVDYLSFISPIELNTASIVFDNELKEIQLSNISEHIERLFLMFLTSMYIFDRAIGSVSNIQKSDEPNNKYSVYFESMEEDYYNYMLREEHEYYANFKSGIFLLRLNNNIYNKTKLLMKHKHQFVDGLDGKILYQIDMDHESYNFVAYDDWNRVNDLIRKMEISQYELICQENHLYLLEDNNIWIFIGDYQQYWVSEEREKIKDRQARENAILHFNRKFQWRYPVKPERFEELIAELLETDTYIQKVRLVGKSNNADGGRDLLIYKRYIQESGAFAVNLVIGQCKAYKSSVNKSHVHDIRDTVEHYDGIGFFLAVSSMITSPLIDHLCKLAQNWDVDWWTEREIFKQLRHHPYIADRFTDILSFEN